MSTIVINGNVLDPNQSFELDAAGLNMTNAADSNYVIIQTAGPATREQKEALASLGVVFLKFVPHDTYICLYEPADLEVIRALPFVTYVNVYLPHLKTHSSTKQAADVGPNILATMSVLSASTSPREVDILFHQGQDPNDEEIKNAVAAKARVDPASLEVGAHLIRVLVEGQYLEDIASLDAVEAIEGTLPAELHNNKARVLMKADNVKINGTKYEGAGQVVAVADTGLDKDHPAFSGRIVKLYDLGRPGTNATDDPHGHGTHVSGSVLGDGSSPSMGGKIQGTAPKAKLVLQSLYRNRKVVLGGIPSDLTNLFSPPYDDFNARVHSNSWGSDSKIPSMTRAAMIDTFVWNKPDMVILFSSGNSGLDADADGVVDLGQVMHEASAKNCITVGASENDRPNMKVIYDNFNIEAPIAFPAEPIRSDNVSDDPNGMAAFSSRGPSTPGERFKPDVVAPGTNILSALSSIAPRTPSLDPKYFFLHGTSMATPLVSGCCAVLRESLVKNGHPNPSAALIKALLINGAEDLKGQYSPTEAGPSPNNVSGWGIVNLTNSIILPGHHPDAGCSDNSPPLKHEGDKASFTITIPARSQDTSRATTLKITLVWTDPAGEALQNDLDLIVVASDGSERHGNVGESGGFDRVNNVEQIRWTGIPEGEATVTVTAHRITQGPQPFAYAWRISH